MQFSQKMSVFREIRKTVLQTHIADLLDTEECLLLYDLSNSKTLIHHTGNILLCNLDNLSDDECISEVKFYKSDIYRLLNILKMPQEVSFTLVESFCLLLKRFAYPYRASYHYLDMVPRFGQITFEIDCEFQASSQGRETLTKS